MTAVSLLESAPLDEAAVLRRARRGDRHAYGPLYERHLAGARRVAASLVRQPSDVDDVVAEAFASAFAAMRRGARRLMCSVRTSRWRWGVVVRYGCVVIFAFGLLLLL
ncbi:MAG: hypothetical protein M3487_00225 [Actinomycetota bacterium]|nr:hypothetical protein [Actinomycetota bacterium]